MAASKQACWRGRAASTVPPCTTAAAEYLRAAGNWIHTSGLDLDKDVPPSPNHFTDVWWVQINGAEDGTHRRASCFSTNTYRCSFLQLIHVTWVFLPSTATLSHFTFVFAAVLWSFLISVPVSKNSSSSPSLTPWLVSLPFLTVPGHQPQVSMQQVLIVRDLYRS